MNLVRRFLVVNNEFNRANYPGLIGLIYEAPPPYVAVEPIDIQEKPFVDSPWGPDYYYSTRSEHKR